MSGFTYHVRYSETLGAPIQERREHTFAGCAAFILYCLRNDYHVNRVWRVKK